MTTGRISARARLTACFTDDIVRLRRAAAIPSHLCQRRGLSCSINKWQGTAPTAQTGGGLADLSFPRFAAASFLRRNSLKVR
ncbi:MAG: hypothetical protein ACLUEQ_11820 [Cloacibacillus evryensis]